MVEKSEVMERVMEHYNESKEYFSDKDVVGIFLQGSQNYGLDYEGSDVDTKLITLPSFEDLAFNRKPVSTTHVRANNEHADWKDIRLYMETFRKQNLNFLEILFTKFKYVNPQYEEFWNVLVENREAIARYNVYRGVKSMKGIAMEKYHAMEHQYPARMHMLEKYGYDPKQLHHLLRVEDYLKRYIEGELYEKCLQPTDPQFLMDVKLGKYDLTYARERGFESIENVKRMADESCEKTPNEGNAQ